MDAHGGLLTAADFASHTADWVEPITVRYRGRTAFNLPPNTQGMASLEILNILENFDVAALGEGTAAYYHLLVEATKEAFADRDRWLTDPGARPQSGRAHQHGEGGSACAAHGSRGRHHMARRRGQKRLRRQPYSEHLS